MPRSLTDDDLEELKGCVDLGFGFSYNEIPELCGTLPALELCYSMSQRFLDEHQPPSKVEDLAPEPPAVVPPPPAQPIPNWKISCPGKLKLLDPCWLDLAFRCEKLSLFVQHRFLIHLNSLE